MFRFIILIISWCFYTQVCISQTKELIPVSTYPVELSARGEQEYENIQHRVRQVNEKINSGTCYEELTPQEKEALENFTEKGDYYSIIKSECSWNCGTGPGEISASSHLASREDNNFLPGYAHDLSFKNAWAEGVNGYGIGEFLLYTFSSTTRRIDHIYVVNGFARSENDWINYSRAKKIRVYINDQPYAMLNLKNIRGVQQFNIDPRGSSAIRNREMPDHLTEWTMKFEIIEVYKGLKYDDVVITEIYFHDHDYH